MKKVSTCYMYVRILKLIELAYLPVYTLGLGTNASTQYYAAD